MTASGPAETLLIINPVSAGGKTLRRWPGIHRALERRGVITDVHFTTAPQEATARTREALAAGYRRVVGIGGDGTLNELVNGYFNPDGSAVAPDAALGLIPSGTGGDFRRTTRVLDVEAAVAALAAGGTVRIDAGRIDFEDGHHHFLNIADWGVGGDVVRRVNQSRFKGGGARGTAVFLAISLAELLTYGTRGVDLRIDGRSLHREISNVVVANGRYFGGGMQVAPKAQLGDGLFDVVLVGPMARWRTLTGMPRIYRGSHLDMPGIEYLRAKEIHIVPTGTEPLRFEAEGEVIGVGAATVTCLPAAVPFVM